jgi:cytochrome c biogenesis protein CcmG/thiol:disulfide interchange protein DsbE
VADLPLLERDIYSVYKSKGLEILSISINDNEEIIKSIVAKNNLTYPMLVDKDGTVARSYKVTGIPLNIIVDKKGIIQYRQTGYDPGVIGSIIEKFL